MLSPTPESDRERVRTMRHGGRKRTAGGNRLGGGTDVSLRAKNQMSPKQQVEPREWLNWDEKMGMVMIEIESTPSSVGEFCAESQTFVCRTLGPCGKLEDKARCCTSRPPVTHDDIT